MPKTKIPKMEHEYHPSGDGRWRYHNFCHYCGYEERGECAHGGGTKPADRCPKDECWLHTAVWRFKTPADVPEDVREQHRQAGQLGRQQRLQEPKSQWWKSKTYDWVFIQEIPFDPATGEFVWSAAKDPTERRVSWLRWMQKVRYIENKKRGESDSEQE